jgi:hypothetical protein
MIWALGVGVVVGAFVGFMLGVHVEAADWRGHAITRRGAWTSYFSGDGYYYVFPEREFSALFELKPGG